MTNRADQAGLVVQDIARSSVILKHQYKLDAKTRAEVSWRRKGARKAAKAKRSKPSKGKPR